MIDYAAAREAMVDRQVRPSDVTRYPIIAAMLAVPREEFLPEALRPVAYLGEHVPLAPGRVLLDPRVFAKLLDALDVGTEDLVLDSLPVRPKRLPLNIFVPIFDAVRVAAPTRSIERKWTRHTLMLEDVR